MPAAMLNNFFRIPLGTVFVGTALVKLMDVPEFARHLGDFGIVADGLVPVVAWLICLTELVAGLGLMAHVRGSLATATALLLLFMTALIYGMVLGLDIDCGCLGPTFSVGLRVQFLMDVVLVAWCGLVYLTRRRHGATSEGPTAAPLAASNPRGTSP